jgi:hypothetical protein
MLATFSSSSSGPSSSSSSTPSSLSSFSSPSFVPHLFCLSYDILFEIFKYLNSCDIVILSRTYKYFYTFAKQNNYLENLSYELFAKNWNQYKWAMDFSSIPIYEQISNGSSSPYFHLFNPIAKSGTVDVIQLALHKGIHDPMPLLISAITGDNLYVFMFLERFRQKSKNHSCNYKCYTYVDFNGYENEVHSTKCNVDDTLLQISVKHNSLKIIRFFIGKCIQGSPDYPKLKLYRILKLALKENNLNILKIFFEKNLISISFLDSCLDHCIIFGKTVEYFNVFRYLWSQFSEENRSLIVNEGRAQFALGNQKYRLFYFMVEKGVLLTREMGKLALALIEVKPKILRHLIKLNYGDFNGYCCEYKYWRNETAFKFLKDHGYLCENCKEFVRVIADTDLESDSENNFDSNAFVVEDVVVKSDGDEDTDDYVESDNEYDSNDDFMESDNNYDSEDHTERDVSDYDDENENEGDASGSEVESNISENEVEVGEEENVNSVGSVENDVDSVENDVDSVNSVENDVDSVSTVENDVDVVVIENEDDAVAMQNEDDAVVIENEDDVVVVENDDDDVIVVGEFDRYVKTEKKKTKFSPY